ncbi:MAG: RND transporter [Gammaproteobacteria bacterium]|nr:RND transporter [Gammaproteobacteria bacterium]
MMTKIRMLKVIDRIPLLPLTIAAIFMSLAPFSPEPHLVEKTRMLINAELVRPIDIFDLFWHSIFIILLAIRLLRYKTSADEK